MLAYQSFLTDITNVQGISSAKTKLSLAVKEVKAPVKNSNTICHDPYNWKCIPDGTPSGAEMFKETQVMSTPEPQDLFQEKGDQAPAAPPGPEVCNALIQFKCRQLEFSSPVEIEKGQYVVVQGDRGIDIGVVIRINNDCGKTYVERTGPVGSVLRHATQAEVDYWATDLKEAEVEAAEYCQAQVCRHGYDMTIIHAEYQFDKKKLTFYYEARVRIDFVQMLKDLYRQFGCRIWMEKVRNHE